MVIGNFLLLHTFSFNFFFFFLELGLGWGGSYKLIKGEWQFSPLNSHEIIYPFFPFKKNQILHERQKLLLSLPHSIVEPHTSPFIEINIQIPHSSLLFSIIQPWQHQTTKTLNKVIFLLSHPYMPCVLL